MTLPKRPSLSNPIPNANIPNNPRQHSIKAPYWDAILSGSLVVTEDGSLAIEGSTTPSTGEVEVLGEYWSMPLGNGSRVRQGELRTTALELPPYGCRTDVLTTGVTNFTDAWRECTFSSFPGDIDTSAGTNFSSTWYGCENLTSFPPLNVSSGENFDYAWFGCSLLSSFPILDVSSGTSFAHAWEFCNLLGNFPVLDVSSGESFYAAWGACHTLSSFPALNFSSGQDFTYAWLYCTALETFPANVFDNCPSVAFYNAWNHCALSQQSVDNILVSLDAAGQTNGIVSIDQGTSAAPGAAGIAAKASLVAKGWVVLTN